MQAKNINFVTENLLFLLKFVWIVFVSSIISLHVINESLIKLAKHLPSLQLHIVGFQI